MATTTRLLSPSRLSPINAGSTLWLSGVGKISGLKTTTSQVTLQFINQTISVIAGGVTYSLAVPDATILVVPGSTLATTDFEPDNTWL